MKRVFDKETFRAIGGSLGRFLAIAGIVALGCGFYAGLRMTGSDMRISGDAFYDGTSLYDNRVLGTLGYTDRQVDMVANVEGVDAVMPGRSTDVMAALDGEQYSMRINSLNVDAASDSSCTDGYNVNSSDDSYLNRIVLKEGRWPTSAGECVLSADRVMSTPIKIGDTVQVLYGSASLDGVLDQRTYTVVGLSHSSTYVSDISMGSTSLGNGSLQQYMYVSDENFSDDCPYTELFVKAHGADGEFAGSDAYQAKVDAVSNRLSDISDQLAEDRLAQVKAEAQKKLDEKSSDYETQKNDANSQLDDAKTQLDSSLQTLDDSQAQIDSGWSQYYDGVSQLAQQKQSAQQQFDAAEQKLKAGEAELPGDQTALNAARAQWQAGSAQMLSGLQAYASYGIDVSSLESADESISQVVAALKKVDPQNPLIAQLLGVQKQVQTLISTGGNLDSWQSGLDKLGAGWQQLSDQRTSAQQQFDAAQAKLDSNWAQLTDAQASVDAGRAEYESGVQEYESKRTSTLDQLADAASAISNAQGDIDAIEKPDVYVLDRTKNYGVSSYDSDSKRIDNIAAVFPFIFFLVAALVALTTMTRMVDEDRVLIGTFKALGYSKARIVWKYLVYAGIASISGAVIGILALSQVLPFTISKAYAIIYNVPAQPFPLHIDVPLALLSAGMGVGITLVATGAAVAATMREQPAELMLPRAPKAGKRIMLERIAPLWRRLSFSWKITWRGLFRYKRRLWMTVIGIAGCTALLLTGLGLHDAIWDIIDKQFGEIVHYNVVVTLKDDATESDVAKTLTYMEDSGQASGMTLAQKENMQVESDSHGSMSVELTIPKDDSAFAGLLTMRDRVTKEPVAFDSHSVVMTEKLARTLGVSVGDTFTLLDQDVIGNPTGSGYRVTLTGIMENYVGNALYMGSDAYSDDVGKTCAFTSIYGTCTEDEGQRSSFTEGLHDMNEVETVAYNDETIDSYRKMLSSVNMIVVVLVTAAAALAFIVLYNLTNINITERRREIASLKVLGFLPREVHAYIFREIFMLTLLGAILGLVLGVWMESFVVVTAEVDYVMFGRDIHMLSFIWAFLLTGAFSLLVMLFMRRKLNQIDMVESLKSVD